MKNIEITIDRLRLSQEKILLQLLNILRAAGINNFGRAISVASEDIGIFSSEECTVTGEIKDTRIVFSNKLYFADAVRVTCSVIKHEYVKEKDYLILIPLQEKINKISWNFVCYLTKNSPSIDILPEGVHI